MGPKKGGGPGGPSLSSLLQASSSLSPAVGSYFLYAGTWLGAMFVSLRPHLFKTQINSEAASLGQDSILFGEAVVSFDLDLFDFQGGVSLW